MPSRARRQSGAACKDETPRAGSSDRPRYLQAHPAEPAGDEVSSVLSPAERAGFEIRTRRRQAQDVSSALPHCDLILAIRRQQGLRQPLGRGHRRRRGIEIHQSAPEIRMLLSDHTGCAPKRRLVRPKRVQPRSSATD